METTKCPKCNADMRLKNGRRGQFWGCTRHPECDASMDLVVAARLKRLAKERAEFRDRLMIQRGQVEELRRQLASVETKQEKPKKSTGPLPKRLGNVLLEYWAAKSGMTVKELKRES